MNNGGSPNGNGAATPRDLESARAEYRRLKALLQDGKYAKYGRIVWRDDVCQVEFKKKFRRSPEESLEVVRRRALGFLDWLEMRQVWRLVEIEIPTSAGYPDYAVVRVRAEVLGLFRFGTALLNEIRS